MALCNECPHTQRRTNWKLTILSASFARCLDLRDKYLALSHQRLGDNPRDHDGTFEGFYPRTAADNMGLRADADQDTCEDPEKATPDCDRQHFQPWKIYPPPPPPHWHWTPAESGVQPELKKSLDVSGSGPIGRSSTPNHPSGQADMHVFRFEDCEIPPDLPDCEFALNDEGVYEVWVVKDSPSEPNRTGASSGADAQAPQSPSGTDVKGKQKEKLARVPSLKEYFTDLDFLLGVCSDGPAKSFAFRRLKYLASKWSLYCLLNEYQELADMKVSLLHLCPPCQYRNILTARPSLIGR